MGAHTAPQGAITHKVVGAAVVLATEDRSERYLYRGSGDSGKPNGKTAGARGKQD